MSGWSESFTCPNCDSKNTQCSGDYKPIDSVSGECLDCGFFYYTETGYVMDLDELNEMRKEHNLSPLTELPKQEEI